MRDHYATLGVARDADAPTIKTAYRKLAAQHHPDKPGGDQAKFQEIGAAYATLSDPDKRAHYDRTGEDGRARPAEMEQLAPLVVGAFDRAVVEAMKGAAPSPTLGGWPTPLKAKGLGRTDIVASMVKLLEADKARGEEANKQLATETEMMQDMQRRLGWNGEAGKNIIASALAQRLRDAADQTAKNTATVALVERAIDHVRLYGWEMDPPPEMATFRWSMDAAGIREMVVDQMRLEMIMPRSSMFGEPWRRRRVPHIFPGTKIELRKPKAKKRRTAVMEKATGLYHRVYTCTLDDEGKQVPRPRGSWAEFEKRVAAAQEAA